MASKKVIIGIDPDTTASGFCIVYLGEKKAKFYEHEIGVLDYFPLFDKILNLFDTYKDTLHVVIERGEKNKGLWNAEAAAKHARFASATKVAAKAGAGIGKNFEATNVIVKFCKYYGIEYSEYTPKTKKLLKTDVMRLFGIVTKVNEQEQRDALRCALQKI